MRITVTSIMVSDQKKALAFYTGKLGFKLKRDIPLGEHSWLTVVPGEEPDGTELLLEPMAFEPAKVYQKALYDAGIPATMFAVTNMEQEYTRLSEQDVVFSMKPTQMGPNIIAVFDDTCGNRIQMVQML